jgi:type I restriction enzyme M protein
LKIWRTINHDYKHIVLPLIFSRCLSLKYDTRWAQLEQMLADPESDLYSDDPEFHEEILSDPHEYRSDHVFVVPEEDHWTYIVKNAKQPNIKEILDTAMLLIENGNADLEGVMPRIYQASNFPAENLGELSIE